MGRRTHKGSDANHTGKPARLPQSGNIARRSSHLITALLYGTRTLWVWYRCTAKAVMPLPYNMHHSTAMQVPCTSVASSTAPATVGPLAAA